MTVDKPYRSDEASTRRGSLESGGVVEAGLGLVKVPSQHPEEGEIHDAVWGKVSADGPSYRNVRRVLLFRRSSFPSAHVPITARPACSCSSAGSAPRSS